MGYQSIWLQKRHTVLSAICACCKKYSCAISTVLSIWLQKTASSARGYQSIWLQKTASSARLPKYLVAKGHSVLPMTGTHYLVVKDTLCYQFQFYQVGKDVLCSPRINSIGCSLQDVLCSPCMQQAGRDVLCSPCIYSIGCRLQEMYCAHHVCNRLQEMYCAHHVCSMLQKTHATYGCLCCTAIQSMFLFSAATFSVLSLYLLLFMSCFCCCSCFSFKAKKSWLYTSCHVIR